jgi:hypothetical protein
MTVVAGVDIGNSTTEIVISEGLNPVAWDRRPTRGRKGSAESIRAASALLRNIQRGAGASAEHVVVAPWRPVLTESAVVHEQPPDTGRVQLVHCAQHSVVGNSAVCGQPWDISTEPPQSITLIAVVVPAMGYTEAAMRINELFASGVDIAGVIVARDEAVLISARISRQVPVVDGADVEMALCATSLFLEVRPPGQTVQTATDVWALRSALTENGIELDALGLIARWVKDERAVIIGVLENAPQLENIPNTASVTWRTGNSIDLFSAIERFIDQPVGVVRSLELENIRKTADVWGVDLTSALFNRGIRVSNKIRTVVIASLSRSSLESGSALYDEFEVPVHSVASESAAAAVGARTTPGLSENALILDIGGGTIDLVGDQGISAAGAGELLSTAVAQVLDVPRGAADWIKRGPARRLDSPQVLLSEDGFRNFVSGTDAPIPANLLGSLVTPGPGGYIPFGQGLQPAEWRIMRQSLKKEVIAENVGRILRTYCECEQSSLPFDIVIVGGPAADDELLPVLGELQLVGALGRGNVAGKLGHRYAVAYGLTQSLDYM